MPDLLDLHGTFKLQSEREAHSTSYWSGGMGSDAECVKFLEQGLIGLQVARMSMKTQDIHKNILIVQKLGHCFDDFRYGHAGKHT
jgi:hypothetical protein